MKKNILFVMIMACAAFCASVVFADTIKVPVNKVSADGIGEQIGTVTFEDAKDGVNIHVDVAGLPAGEHGMHVHVNPSCAPAAGPDGKMGAALSAGGHFDPTDTKTHAGPGKKGHLGDLPFITANAQGIAKEDFTVKGLFTKDIKNHSLMIHAGGDNYTDTPPLGGGGARIACGIIR